jgi:hypothetical protein
LTLPHGETATSITLAEIRYGIEVIDPWVLAGG